MVSSDVNFRSVMQKYTPALCLCGVGHSLRGSTISDGAHFGMLLTGNDHTIAGNHFHDLVYRPRSKYHLGSISFSILRYLSQDVFRYRGSAIS